MVLAYALSSLVVAPAAAQQLTMSQPVFTAATFNAAVAEAGPSDPALMRLSQRPSNRWSPTLWSLYASTVAIQGLDAVSTFRALDAGAVETNPLVSWATPSRPGFLALKMGIASAAIYSAHELSRRHKVRAMIALVAMNSAYAALAAHNYTIARTAGHP